MSVVHKWATNRHDCQRAAHLGVVLKRKFLMDQSDRQTDRQTGRPTDRQTGRQTDAQTDRQTDRQKHTYVHKTKIFKKMITIR